MVRKTKDIQQLAVMYNEIAMYEDAMRVISELCQELVEGDKEVLIGLTVLTDNPPPPQPTNPTITLPFLGIALSPPPPPVQMNEYEWEVNPSIALRVLQAISDGLKKDAEKVKRSL